MSETDLSVVVPSVNGWQDLEGCLEALAQQRGQVGLEVLVVDRLGDELRHRVREKFPWVRVLRADPETTIPQLRALAFEEARGIAVAVIEDHVLVQPGWGRRISTELASGSSVVGGPIDNAATVTLIDWAAFLCEYSHCIPPLPEGGADWLPGNNVGYRRDLLLRYRTEFKAGHWEGHLHQGIQRDGYELKCLPDLIVLHKKHYTFLEYFHQRYLYSRSYAGTRLDSAPPGKRFAFGLATLALPPILLFRIGRQVFAKRRYRGRFLVCLPLIGVFVCAWAAGESIGALFGGGDAMTRVR